MQQQTKIQNWFLVKFMEQSYLHVKWMSEEQLEEYSFKAKQKIRRYWSQKEKKRFIVSFYLIYRHHYQIFRIPSITFWRPISLLLIARAAAATGHPIQDDSSDRGEGEDQDRQD